MDLKRFYCLPILVLFLLVSACSQLGSAGKAVDYPLDPQAVKYSGTGTDSVVVQGFSGLAILHIRTTNGQLPIEMTVETAQKTSQLISTSGPIDEYRALEFSPLVQATLKIHTDMAWTITISPANQAYFSSLKIPGIYQGTGSAVIYLDGEYGVATFKLNPGQDLKAWAAGPGGVNQEIYINPSGDYQGKSVLPEGAVWLIVSTKDAWSVDIQAPCCKVPPGFKPKYNP